MNHPDPPFGRCLPNRFARSLQTKHEQSTRRRPEDGPFFRDIKRYIACRGNRETVEKGRAGRAVRYGAAGATLLRLPLINLRRRGPDPGILRRHGSLRGRLVLPPDLRAPSGTRAFAYGPGGVRRAVAVGVAASAPCARLLDRRAIRLRQRHRTRCGVTSRERVPDLTHEP